MDQGLLTVIEVLLRMALGLRILYSGVSNVLRWPHAVGTTRIAFPKGATFFGFVGVALMVLGGIGVTLGLQTQIAALVIAIFLIPTFKIQWHRLRALPGTVEKVTSALSEKEPRNVVRQLGRPCDPCLRDRMAEQLDPPALGVLLFDPRLRRLRARQSIQMKPWPVLGYRARSRTRTTNNDRCAPSIFLRVSGLISLTSSPWSRPCRQSRLDGYP